MADRLDSRTVLPDGVRRPGYDPEARGAGIVHLGLGAFHRAHQAVYTDDALAAEAGDWRIIGASLRSAAPAEELTAQDGRYTLIERHGDGPHARIIGAIAKALHAEADKAALDAALTSPHTRIVSLTVTEKGYGIDRATGRADRADPVVAADLANPAAPRGVLGRLVAALAARRAAGVAPFTVLSCDNLPDNGRVVRGAVIDFAQTVDPALADHIAAEVAFPCTMVDRITPARTPETLADAARLTGCADHAAIETEPFSQFIVEDRFTAGRPAWDRGGALFVEDVAPYEAMKLRMLNGSHSLIAYSSVVAGHAYVRDAMAAPDLRRLVERHLKAAAATLPPVPGVDLDVYAGDLAARFANPHIGHKTAQISRDGTEKLPQRILAPAAEALARGQDTRPFAFALAAFMRHTLGTADDGAAVTVDDPRREALLAAVAAGGSAGELAPRLVKAGGLAPSLPADPAFMAQTVAILTAMLDQPMAAVLAAEAART
ncbi:MAG: mannitol dehydrogenase family protein [Acuticoccus sp.]